MSCVTHPLNCPLCGQPNQCAIAAGLPAETCWCMQSTIAPQALERIAPAQRGTACICAACGRQDAAANGQTEPERD